MVKIMPDVIALTSFDHDRHPRKRGTRFTVSDPVARDLCQRGLVRIVIENPSQAPASHSSASPAGQASQQTTAKQSGSGGKRGRPKKSGE